jgi:hypothetical protein
MKKDDRPFKDIKEALIDLLKKDQQPEDEKSLEAKLLTLTITWYSQKFLFLKEKTFKKIRKLFFSKCVGIETTRLGEIRRAMVEINETLRSQALLRKQKAAKEKEGKQRVLWEIGHDPDQIDDILTPEYLKDFKFSL